MLLHSVDEFDSYIVVSFINATLVLSIGETVEEVTDSGFLGTTPTLSCSQLGEDALLQVTQRRTSCESLALLGQHFLRKINHWKRRNACLSSHAQHWF